MTYWLIKSEPEAYSLEDFQREKVARWDGVRNYQARNNLRAMQIGDICIFYRSVTKPAAIALGRVAREHYADPTATDGDWSAVDIEFVEVLKNEVSLSSIKANPLLKDMALLKLSRLSVQIVQPDEYQEIIKMSKG